jgi:DNA-directed RNA polymerase specialized sigma24 family protein
VRAALNHLPQEDRELLRNRYYRGRSVRSVAAESGSDPRQLYRRLAHALATVRSAVQNG